MAFNYIFGVLQQQFVESNMARQVEITIFMTRFYLRAEVTAHILIKISE